MIINGFIVGVAASCREPRLLYSIIMYICLSKHDNSNNNYFLLSWSPSEVQYSEVILPPLSDGSDRLLNVEGGVVKGSPGKYAELALLRKEEEKDKLKCVLI